LNIPYQFMTAGTGSEVNPNAKVVVVSPEKLMNKQTMNSIKSLEWSGKKNKNYFLVIFV
jgi:hypothetical protein